MLRRFLAGCISLLAVLHAAAASRLPSSPFPAPIRSPSRIFYLNESRYSAIDVVTVASLQGLLARTSPELFLSTSCSVSPDCPAGLGPEDTLLAHLSFLGGIQVDASLSMLNLTGLLLHYRGEIDGFVLGDAAAAPASVGAAITGAAALPRAVVAVGASAEAAARAAGIPMLLDARPLLPRDVAARYPGSLSGRITVHQRFTSTPCLTGYAVFARAMSWFEEEGSGSAAADAALALLDARAAALGPAAVLGWGTDELADVGLASRHGESERRVCGREMRSLLN